MIEYVARFTELACFIYDYVATDAAKVKRFENGLRLSIWGRIVGLHLQDMNSMVETTMTIERERRRMHGALGRPVLVARGRRVSLLPVWGKGRGLLARAAISRARDRPGLPVGQGRWCASIASSPDI